MAKETLKDTKSDGSAEKQKETVGNKTEPAQGQFQEKGQKGTQEPVYPAEELASNAGKLFGTRQECVTAALKAAGKTECTVSEAQGIVKKFLTKEVE